MGLNGFACICVILHQPYISLAVVLYDVSVVVIKAGSTQISIVAYRARDALVQALIWRVNSMAEPQCQGNSRLPSYISRFSVHAGLHGAARVARNGATIWSRPDGCVVRNAAGYHHFTCARPYRSPRWQRHPLPDLLPIPASSSRSCIAPAVRLRRKHYACRYRRQSVWTDQAD